MIFHASIPADDPERVARVLAEIWKTHYFPFVFPDSYVVISGNEWGNNIEVCKRGDEQCRREWRSDYAAMRLHRATARFTCSSELS
jgi:hypothetical protein